MSKELKLIKHVKRNGHITKNVMAIALYEGFGIDEVKRRVASELRKFPLSSNHLVYEENLTAIEAERGKEFSNAVMEVCLENDKRGLEAANKLWAEAGCKLDTEWGRYKAPKKGKK